VLDLAKNKAHGAVLCFCVRTSPTLYAAVYRFCLSATTATGTTAHSRYICAVKVFKLKLV